MIEPHNECVHSAIQWDDEPGDRSVLELAQQTGVVDNSNPPHQRAAGRMGNRSASLRPSRWYETVDAVAECALRCPVAAKNNRNRTAELALWSEDYAEVLWPTSAMCRRLRVDRVIGLQRELDSARVETIRLLRELDTNKLAWTRLQYEAGIHAGIPRCCVIEFCRRTFHGGYNSHRDMGSGISYRLCRRCEERWLAGELRLPPLRVCSKTAPLFANQIRCGCGDKRGAARYKELARFYSHRGNRQAVAA